jgi:hypothetical protein
MSSKRDRTTMSGHTHLGGASASGGIITVSLEDAAVAFEPVSAVGGRRLAGLLFGVLGVTATCEPLAERLTLNGDQGPLGGELPDLVAKLQRARVEGRYAITPGPITAVPLVLLHELDPLDLNLSELANQLRRGPGTLAHTCRDRRVRSLLPHLVASDLVFRSQVPIETLWAKVATLGTPHRVLPIPSGRHAPLHLHRGFCGVRPANATPNPPGGGFRHPDVCLTSSGCWNSRSRTTGGSQLV